MCSYDPQGDIKFDKLNEDDLSSLKRSRSAYKGRVTLALGKIDIAIADGNTKVVEDCIASAKSSFDRLASSHILYHDQMIIADTDADINASQEFYNNVEQNFIAKLKLARDWLAKQEQEGTPVTPQLNASHTLMSNLSIDDDVSAKDLVNALSAPRGSLTQFNGDPLQYLNFMISFKECVEDKIKDDGIRLSRLIEFCSGVAHEAIKMCAAIGGTAGLTKAKSILKARFGSNEIIGRHIIRNLKDGSEVTCNSSDIVQLSNDLSCAQGVLASLNMSRLATDDLVKEIIMRCPYYMQRDWRKFVFIHSRTSKEGSLPGFEQFVKFIGDKATDASNLLYGNEYFTPKSPKPVV